MERPGLGHCPALGCHPVPEDQRRWVAGQSRSLRTVLESGQGWGFAASLFPVQHIICRQNSLRSFQMHLPGSWDARQRSIPASQTRENTGGASFNFADPPIGKINCLKRQRFRVPNTLATQSALSCDSRGHAAKQDGAASRQPGGVALEPGALAGEGAVAGEPRGAGWRGIPDPGAGGCAGWSEADTSADVGAPHVCTVPWADFHATCNELRIVITKQRTHTTRVYVFHPICSLPARPRAEPSKDGAPWCGCPRTGSQQEEMPASRGGWESVQARGSEWAHGAMECAHPCQPHAWGRCSFTRGWVGSVWDAHLAPAEPQAGRARTFCAWALCTPGPKQREATVSVTGLRSGRWGEAADECSEDSDDSS